MASSASFAWPRCINKAEMTVPVLPLPALQWMTTTFSAFLDNQSDASLQKSTSTQKGGA